MTARGGDRVLARNAVVNLAGQALPLVVALAAIPLLVGGLDESRLGILTLAWAAIGYFTMLDLGLGRALTQAVAARDAEARTHEVPSVVWTTLACMGALGVAGAIALAVGA